MTVLGGDSHFNKWVVPLIPLASLPKVDLATHALMFADQEEATMEEVDASESQVPDVIAKDQRVPFPQDWVGIFLFFFFVSFSILFIFALDFRFSLSFLLYFILFCYIYVFKNTIVAPNFEPTTRSVIANKR